MDTLKCPRTQVTIMWRAQNPAAVCPGSKTHFAVGRLPSAGEDRLPPTT